MESKEQMESTLDRSGQAAPTPVNLPFFNEILEKVEAEQATLKININHILEQLLNMDAKQENDILMHCTIELFNNHLKDKWLKNRMDKVLEKVESISSPLPYSNFNFNNAASTDVPASASVASIPEKLSVFEQMRASFLIDLKEVCKVSLLKQTGFIDLIGMVRQGLVETFKSLEDGQIVTLTQIFFSPLIEHIKDTAQWAKMNPEQYLESDPFNNMPLDERPEIDETSISQMTNNALQAFEIIQDCLKESQNDRNINVDESAKSIQSRQEAKDHNTVFLQYFRSALLNNSNSNPLNIQALLGNFLNILDAVCNKYKRRNSDSQGSIGSASALSPSSVSPPAVLRRNRTLEPGEKIQIIHTDSKETSQKRMLHSRTSSRAWGYNLLPTYPYPENNSPEVHYEDKQEDAHSNEETDTGREDATWVIVHSVGSLTGNDRPQRRIQCFPTNEPENLAALWQRFPAVEGFNDALSLHTSLKQILKVYPNASQSAAPYLILFDIVGGTTGALIGRYAILNPKSPLHPAVRVWKAATDGLSAFVFTLGSAIQTYLAVHPNTQYISDEKFWGELAPVPLGLMISHTLWYSFSPLAKERWFPLKTRKQHIKYAIDFLTRCLFNSRIYQTGLLNFIHIPNEPLYNVLYQAVPFVPALITTFAQLSSRFQQRANGLMIYLSAINFSIMLVKDFLSDKNETLDAAHPLAILRLVYYILLVMLPLPFLIKHAVTFINNFEDPEIITQEVRLEIARQVRARKHERSQTQIAFTSLVPSEADEIAYMPYEDEYEYNERDERQKSFSRKNSVAHNPQIAISSQTVALHPAPRTEILTPADPGDAPARPIVFSGVLSGVLSKSRHSQIAAEESATKSGKPSHRRYISDL